MAANLVSQKLRVFIGADSQGWSLSVGSFVAGYSSLDESGLIKISGTLEIQRDLLNPESIDARANPSRWRPGQPVRVQIRNSSGAWVPHPLGYLHLLEEPDPPAEGGISLSVGCLLSWVDSFEFDDDQSGITLGTAENCAAIATRLLLANEIPAGNIDLGSWEFDLAYPSAKTSGGSFVSQAGELAYSNNWRYLYQDASGVIRSQGLSTAPGAPVATITLGLNDVTFAPLRDPQSPVELVKVAGVGFEIQEMENGKSTVTVGTGDSSDVSPACSGTATLYRETVTRNWVIPTDLTQDIATTTTTTIEELRGAVWVDISSSPCSLVAWKRTAETKRYPQSGPDALRLKTHTVQTEQREGSLIASGTPLNWRTTNERIISYTYGASEAISQVETIERVAELTVDKASENPFQLRIARKDVLSWEEIAPQNWEHKERLEVARIVEDSAIDRFNGNPWARRTTTTSPQSDTGSTQPPRTELWGGIHTQKERHYEGTANWVHPGGSTGRTRKRLYTVPHGFSESQCSTLAGLHRDLLVGRHYGYEIELPITDALLAAGPLFQINVVDPASSITYRLLADGVSWAHTSDRASVYCLGILLDSYVGLEPVYARSGITAPAAEFGTVAQVAFEAAHGVAVPAAEFGAAVEVAFEITHGVTVPAAQFGAAVDVISNATHGLTVPAAEFGANVQGPVEATHGLTVPAAQFGAVVDVVVAESSTKLLLNFEGSNGQTSYTSEDNYARALTFSGDAQISTTQSKFGASSLFLPVGASTTFVNTSSMLLSASDFTFECWLWLTSGFASNDFNDILIGPNKTWALERPSSGGAIASIASWFVDTGGSFRFANSGVFDTADIPLETWGHFAVTRQGSTFRYFFNGVLRGTSTFSQTVGDDPLVNWAIRTDSGQRPKYLDGMRLVIGQALYTANFTPSTSAPGIVD